MDCIFMDADQAATNRYMAPNRFANLARFERMTGKTIKRGKSLEQLADEGTIHPEAYDPCLVALAMGHEYPEDMVLIPEDREWVLPPGAFKESGGPT
jgi:hypothetical protein